EKEFGLRMFHCWGDDGEYGIQCDHAGANETSIMMAVRPELVHMEYLDPNPDVFPLCVGGRDPRLHASAGYGNECIDRQSKRMSELILKALERDST
ncbi:MAG: creatininase family protein, partial [Defluviitaleaceae bacterium]|nr:creatininase family protein [Defluviitaleaceae bacterium]